MERLKKTLKHPNISRNITKTSFSPNWLRLLWMVQRLRVIVVMIQSGNRMREIHSKTGQKYALEKAFELLEDKNLIK